MKALWSAIRARYKGDPTLLRLGRKLVRGYEGEPVDDLKPFVDCTMELTESLDTFTTDIEMHNATFTFWSKDQKPDTCDNWIEAMTAVFDKAQLSAAGLISVGCQKLGAASARLKNGVYECSITFEMIVQRTANLPVTRGA